MRASGGTLTMLCAGTLLCGCTASTRPLEAAQPLERDCSFRSATTCWVAARRIPVPRPDPAAPHLERLRERHRAVLASMPDSAAPAAADDREVTP
ncbi:MAG TPA: hypothetical protein VFG66_05130 [Gemmatimonadales bacterium]|nr:hypothetical protein [Gemmatimonadales bacterium]